MTEWIYDNSGPFILAALGGLVTLIGLLIRLTWSAARLVTAVESLVEKFEESEEENEKVHAELHSKLDRHSGLLAKHHGRISALESAGGRSSASWNGNEGGNHGQ